MFRDTSGKSPEGDYLPEIHRDRMITKIQHYYDYLKGHQTCKIDPEIEDLLHAYEKLFKDILSEELL